MGKPFTHVIHNSQDYGSQRFTQYKYLSLSILVWMVIWSIQQSWASCCFLCFSIKHKKEQGCQRGAGVTMQYPWHAMWKEDVSLQPQGKDAQKHGQTHPAASWEISLFKQVQESIMPGLLPIVFSQSLDYLWCPFIWNFRVSHWGCISNVDERDNLNVDFLCVLCISLLQVQLGHVKETYSSHSKVARSMPQLRKIRSSLGLTNLTMTFDVF